MGSQGHARRSVDADDTLHEINPHDLQVIPDVLDDAFRRNGPRPAFTSLGRTVTFRELDRLSRDFAAYLEGIGLKPGDRIALQLPNLIQYPIALFGALRAGLIVVNVNPLYTAPELEHVLRDSGARALVVLANIAAPAARVVPGSNVETVIVTEVADLHPPLRRTLINSVLRYVRREVPNVRFDNRVSFREALRRGNGAAFTPHKVRPDDTAALQYTGGTTGRAKAAILTQWNLVANMIQLSHVLPFTIGGPEGVQHYDETWAAPLPLYHIYGFTVHAMALFFLGGHSVLIPNPRDIPGLVKLLAGTPVTGFVGLNTLFNALCDNEDFRKLDFSDLHITISGGMPLTRRAAERWLEITGVTITEGYGLTEASPVISSNRLDEQVLESIGRPVYGTEIRVVDDKGKDVAPGERGELWARGPQVMHGYWNRPEETAQTLTDDGWLRTGDVATQDEHGILRIVDRIKDIVIVSGFNVYPVEIDNVCADMPGIVECAAVGMPDAHSGEAVWLYVVAQDETLTEKAIRDFCRERLTAYKVPRKVVFCDALPKTNVGKIRRRSLKDEAEASGRSA